MRIARSWGSLLLLLAARPAFAHENTQAFGDLDVNARGATLTVFARFEDWDQAVAGLDADRDGKLTNAELLTKHTDIRAWLVPAIVGRSDKASCPATVPPPTVAVRAGKLYVRTIMNFACEAPLLAFTLRYHLFATLHPGHRMLTRIRAGENNEAYLFITNASAPAEHTVFFRGAPPTSIWHSLTAFIAVGVRHILLGYDHILFLLALLLTGGRRRDLLATITAFTLAHSITLALAVLGFVRPVGSLVEPLIALSIALVASSNVWRPQAPSRWRHAVAFCLGLVHGFGFASVLTEMDLSRTSLVGTLMGFNLGVEIGQLAIVVVSYPILVWLQRQPFRIPAVRVLSALVGAAGLFWFVQRLAG